MWKGQVNFGLASEGTKPTELHANEKPPRLMQGRGGES
jgi:hypothetical protein